MDDNSTTYTLDTNHPFIDPQTPLASKQDTIIHTHPDSIAYILHKLIYVDSMSDALVTTMADHSDVDILQIANRREAREAFLRGEGKHDPSGGVGGRSRDKDSYERERENAKEKMSMMSNGGGGGGGHRPMPSLSKLCIFYICFVCFVVYNHVFS